MFWVPELFLGNRIRAGAPEPGGSGGQMTPRNLPGVKRELRNSDSFDSFKRFMKTLFSLAATSVFSALEVIFCNEMRYINLRFTYLLTYLPPDFLERNIFWYKGQLIIIKIIKIVATCRQILRLKDPLAGFKGACRNVALIILTPPVKKIVLTCLNKGGQVLMNQVRGARPELLRNRLRGASPELLGDQLAGS